MPFIEIIENTLEKTTADITEISKVMKNASELITNSNETRGDRQWFSYIRRTTKISSRKIKSSRLKSSDSSNKLKIDVGLPPIDFSKILKDSQTLIKVEYQSAYSVVLRADEERFLLLNGTLALFSYAIDIVKKHGYQYKEVT